MAGSVTPFVLAGFFFSIPSSSDPKYGGIVRPFVLAFLGLMGIFAVAFAIVQFLDAEHSTLWGAWILAGYAFVGLIVTLLIVMPSLLRPGVQDLPIVLVALAGPILGATGGVWGLVWKGSQPSQAGVPGKSRLGGFLWKKWFLVLLLILLALETSILILIAVEWSLGNQSFPPISLRAPVANRCTSLTATIVVQAAGNRTVMYDCSGSPGKGPALAMDIFSGVDGVPAVPVFTLPQGYQKLWLVDVGLGDCLSTNRIPLASGAVVALGAGDAWEDIRYDYCAAVSPTGPVGGFTVRWSLGHFPPYVPPPPPFKLSLSPTNITVPAGQTQNITATVTSLGKLNGTVSLSGGFTGGPNPMGYIELSFRTPVLLVKAGGSNSTIVTVITFTNSQRGVNSILIFAESASWGSFAAISIAIT